MCGCLPHELNRGKEAARARVASWRTTAALVLSLVGCVVRVDDAEQASATASTGVAGSGERVNREFARASRGNPIRIGRVEGYGNPGTGDP